MMDPVGYAPGAHRIVRKLGMGHTSEVLLAVASGPFGFERTVVLKRLLAKHEREEELQRVFAAEALAHARLEHPAIVRLYDFTSTDGRLELVLEYVDGVSLTRVRTMFKVQGIPFGDAPAMFIASRVFSALAAAHTARDPKTGILVPVIHRDVSPGNILVPWDGFVKIGDFGMAKVVGFASDTQVGMLKGTFGYMAPEQVLGDPVTPRTDVYGACIVLREMLLGRPTFVRGDLPELEFLRVMSEPKLEPIESLRNGLSPALTDALRRGLSPDPAYRTLTADEMVNILRAAADLDAGREELVAKLSRVRPSATRGTGAQRISTPPLGTRGVSQSDYEQFEQAVISSSRPDWPRPDWGDSPLNSRSAFDTPAAMSLSPAMSSIRVARDSVRPSILPPAPFRFPAWVVPAAAAAFVFLGLSTSRPMPPCESSMLAMVPHDPATRTHAIHQLDRSHTVDRVRIEPSPLLATSIDGSADAAIDGGSHETDGTIVTPASARAHRVFLDGRVVAEHSGRPLRVSCGRHTIRIGSSGAARIVLVPCGGEVVARP